MRQHFHREDIYKILEVLEKFPNAGSFDLEINAESGIGTTGTMILPTVVNDMHAELHVQVWGAENW
jgi:hypothetical protein